MRVKSRRKEFRCGYIPIFCILGFSHAQQMPVFSSVYTPLGFYPGKCDSVYPDSLVHKGNDCPGVDSFPVAIEPDAPNECSGKILFERLSIRNHEVMPAQFGRFAPGSTTFYKFGRKIEWRLANGKPFALIVRVKHYYANDPEFCRDGVTLFRESLEIFGLFNFSNYGKESILFNESVDARTCKDANVRVREIADSAYCVIFPDSCPKRKNEAERTDGHKK
jgi:hypothetical protein